MNLIFSFLVLLVSNSKDIFSPPVRCRSFASWLAALLPHLPAAPVQNSLNKDAGEGLLISATPTGRSRIKTLNLDMASSRCMKMPEMPTSEDAVGVNSPSPLGKGRGKAYQIMRTHTALSRCVKMHEMPTPEDAFGVSSPSPLGEGRGEAHFHESWPRPSQRDISPQSASP